MRTSDALLDEALQLPDDERALLALRLAESLAGAPDPESEAAWARGIARRVERLREGALESCPVPRRWLVPAPRCPHAVPDVLEAASREMAHAATRYEGWRAGYGDRFLEELQGAFDSIDRFPLLGSPWLLEGVPEGVRRVVLRAFPYSIVYVTEPRSIVIALVHASMSPVYWIDRLDEAK